MSVINTIVTASNAIGFWAAYEVRRKPVSAAVIGAAALASTLMHISERKHGLPGISPFNQWSHEFLQIDRAMSLIAGAYGAHSAFRNNRLGKSLVSIVLTGLSCLRIAEDSDQALIDAFGANPVVLGASAPQWIFAAFHCVWHCMAFTALAIACA